MNFTDFYKRSLNVLNEDFLTRVTVFALDDKEIIELNQNQLILGHKSTGKKMPFYKDETIEIKKRERTFISPSDRIALANTFDFFNGFKVKKTVNSAFVFSTDSKSDMLVSQPRFGEDIFGLTTKNTEKALNSSRDSMIKLTQKALGL